MAISVVQRKAGSNAGTGNLAVAFTSNNTANNTIIAIGAVDDSSASVITISDSQSNTYGSAVYTYSDGAGNFTSANVWVANGIKAGANTVTLGNGSFFSVTLHIFEVSGLAVSSPFDVSSTVLTNQLVSPLTTNATGTTNFANELVMGVFIGNGTTQSTFTVGSGFSNLLTAPFITSVNSSTEEKIVSSIGTQTASLSFTGGNSGFDIFVVTFSDGGVVTATPIPAIQTQIANKNVGPQVLRYNFHQPYIPRVASAPVVNPTTTGGTLPLLWV